MEKGTPLYHLKNIGALLSENKNIGTKLLIIH